MNKKELQHRVAKINPYASIERVVLKKPSANKYMGVKNVKQIPYALIKQLEATQSFVLHTLDAHALGGRAIDIRLKNPITGRAMSGSSSGTAINVLCHINDLGIGTDGGGSVLAPAMATNLYSFISSLIMYEEMSKYSKKSTDNIEFFPSIGFMARDLSTLLIAIEATIPQDKTLVNQPIFIDKADCHSYPFDTTRIEFVDRGQARQPMIDFLDKVLAECAFLISYEGPIDVDGIGDTIFGHFDKNTKAQQSASNKGLIRVVNMVNATALTIPDTALGCGFVCICESSNDKLSYMLEKIKLLPLYQDELIEHYFSNLEMYFPTGIEMEE